MEKARFFLALGAIMVLVLAFPEVVRAELLNEGLTYTVRQLYYYDGGAYGSETEFASEAFQFIGDFSDEAQALVIFCNLPVYGDRIRSLRISDNTVIVNIEGELSESGGTAYEAEALRLFLKNAQQFGVCYFTLISDSEITKAGFLAEKLPIEYLLKPIFS